MKYVVANWKMYLDTRGGVALVRAMMRTFRGKDVLPEVVVCPSFLAIGELKKVLSRSRIHLGAQDAFWENDGPYTGSVSPTMLREAGCDYVILGHSERREELGETSAMVARKVRAVLASGSRVVLCIGKDIGEQLVESLNGVSRKQVEEALLVAYEPEGAISGHGGSGAEDLETVLEAISVIRTQLECLFGPGLQVPVLYGGSVNGENAYTYLREDTIDGVLVGSASVKLHHIMEIVASALRAMTPGTL
ncbi:MAG: Triosephosphate isomerase [Candidatus Giovannonibacteria bacterium GW2011_GWA2_53_7]|uniref:Triosephosphate isomerase n=1 Tax=Candidatus Giovannonibacteria bacterium GW2011_GWA2_53_7 TaxID=1618650 RepID=A0A0G2A8D2_9BACT|nr:MAG: Triosephosphate isomerase [Candidatus Giovannonibacteria bacterium GW2011_GWA2_53_7]